MIAKDDGHIVELSLKIQLLADGTQKVATFADISDCPGRGAVCQACGRVAIKQAVTVDDSWLRVATIGITSLSCHWKT